MLAVVLIILPSALFGQREPLDITGSWKADILEGPQTIVVHGDSTVSFGEETVRIRVLADTIYIQFGDEWVGYNFELLGEDLTLSGGDLEEPIVLKRTETRSPGDQSPRNRGAPDRVDEG